RQCAHQACGRRANASQLSVERKTVSSQNIDLKCNQNCGKGLAPDVGVSVADVPTDTLQSGASPSHIWISIDNNFLVINK
ncbi:hypothetical protein, partial [Pseudomonas cyclaminis]|uniref:hypothetical protein n=1 Tax=Pseudomonas cyclaminis TaxID=2781239 RepID=UPI0019D55824